MLPIIERIILPLLFSSQAIWELFIFISSKSNLLQISNIIKPILIAVLMVFATKKQRVVNLKTTIGLLLSFGSMYFVQIEENQFSKLSALILTAALIFYILLGLVGILNLGRSFSILPSSNKSVTTGLYSLVRHPIYSSYIHILIIFVLIHFNFRNIVLSILFIAGLLLRSIEEEKLLSEDVQYQEKMFGIPRYFNYAVSLPVILTISSLLFDQFRSVKNYASLNISGPIYSLIPTDADDWSSFLVMNHIYPRFIQRSGDFRSNSIIANKRIDCEDKRYSLLSSSCKRVIFNFEIKNNFSGCNNKKYTLKNFKNELEMILLKKNWILPNFSWCKESQDCFSFDNVPNIQNHLESIYLRFGWSLFDANDSLVGIIPNCFKIEELQGKTITRGLLQTTNWKVEISTNETNPDIFLFENSSSDDGYQNVKFYNPIYYFLVVNGDLNNQAPTWISKEIIDHINKEFSNESVFKNDRNNDYLLSDFQNLKFNLSEYKPATSNKVIAFPDYLESCPKLINELNSKVKSTDPYISFECVHISDYIESGVKKGKPWDAFIGPLTPGLPGKNALATQYFSSTSSDRWLGRKYPKKTRVALLGISHGSMLLKKSRFCSIIPNSLGLSDLTIDDFKSCN